MPPSYIPGNNNMAAVEGDRVQSLRGYCHLLSAENNNNKTNRERFKCYSGIDPYPVSANFFPWSMDKWSEVEFPDMVNYFHFSTSKLVKNTSKPTNVFSPTKTSLLMVWEVSLWEKWPQIVNALQDDGSKKCNLQNSASSRLKLRLSKSCISRNLLFLLSFQLLFVLHRKICLNFSRYGRHITF